MEMLLERQLAADAHAREAETGILLRKSLMHRESDGVSERVETPFIAGLVFRILFIPAGAERPQKRGSADLQRAKQRVVTQRFRLEISPGCADAAAAKLLAVHQWGIRCLAVHTAKKLPAATQ